MSKIKNATATKSHGVKFKSKLEAIFYNKCLSAGLKVSYEPDVVVIWEGFRPKEVNICVMGKEPEVTYSTRKILDTKYIPDFKIVSRRKKKIIYIETKGYPNDSFPMKRKMFLKTLELTNDGYDYYYFEIKLVKQMDIVIKEIKKILNEKIK